MVLLSRVKDLEAEFHHLASLLPATLAEELVKTDRVPAVLCKRENILLDRLL